MGAFIGVPGAHIQTNNFARCFPGMYAIPRIQVDVRCVFTNTVRPDLIAVPAAGSELRAGALVDEAARVSGIDPIKLRRRNLIAPNRFLTRPRPARPSTPAILRRSRQALALSHYTEFKSAGARRCGAADCAASASRAFSSTPAAFRPKVRRDIRGRQARARHRRAEYRQGHARSIRADRWKLGISGSAGRAIVMATQIFDLKAIRRSIAFDHDVAVRSIVQRI